MPLPRPVPKETAPSIKVYSTKENVTKYIKHPRGTAFTAEGVAFWPDDAFTHRREKDGDITREAPKGATPRAPSRESKPA